MAERQIRAQLVTDEMVHQARQIVRIFNAEDGKREDFNAAAEELYKLTGRNEYRTGNIYSILNLAQGIIVADTRRRASGNSGSH